MIAYVTSVGEPTTELCFWALERNGFEVTLLEDKRTTLAKKLRQIYTIAEGDFLRVDADVIVNKNMTPALLERLGRMSDVWWWQFQTFDWFKQDIGHSMAFIRTPALPIIKEAIDEFIFDLRPETQVSRVAALHNPRRMETYAGGIMGLHGFGIKDFDHVIELKQQRKQEHLYDFELAGKLNGLC